MEETQARADAALGASEARYSAIVQSALDAIIVTDGKGLICEFNPSAERLFGWPRRQVLGRDVANVIIPPELRRQHRQGMARHHLATGRSVLLGRRVELVALCADGLRISVEMTITRGGSESEPLFTSFIRDLSEPKRLQRELLESAGRDAVTGLDRFPGLEQKMISMIGQGSCIAVLLIDLDRFHGINEAIGHEQGDQVLRATGDRLRAFSSQTVGVCHLASDEFVVCAAVDSEAAGCELAERIRRALAAPIESDHYRVLLTATVGVSMAPTHGRLPLDLIRRAQAATERGKAFGRDGVFPFLTEQMREIEDRVTLGANLREAVGSGELSLHYQGQFAAADGALKGFEALLRWNSVVFGAVTPARFIPIAEALGLMPEIGKWVVREACRQARAWLDQGLAGFTISINVSPQQLVRQGLVAALSAALDEFRLPGAMLELEITESALVDNVARVQIKLARLKALGVSLSLDDFGTGYSGLSYLKSFALDRVKIDQSFVRGLPDNLYDAAICRTIVSLGHELGLRVTAEGIETTAQAEFLRDIGCDDLQGYLLAMPTPADQASRCFDQDLPAAA